MEKQTNLFLGSGTFSWHSFERVSDRYGTFFLFKIDKLNDKVSLFDTVLLNQLQGSFGTLKARVVNTRKSTHIGDLFRGFRPTTPNVNECIILGTGFLFTERKQGIISIGLKPKINKTNDWLNPLSLYKCHEQDVDVYFYNENEE